jgi:hypothetical protein
MAKKGANPKVEKKEKAPKAPKPTKSNSIKNFIVNNTYK